MNKDYNIDIIINKRGCDKMEDENKIKDRAKLFLTILISLIIIGIIVATIYIVGKGNETEKLNKYLKENGYTKENETYYKQTKKVTNEYTTTTNYNYNTTQNLFSKEIMTNGTDYQEQATLTYNGSKNITISYSYTKYDNTTHHSITQSGTYNHKNNDFECKIETSEGNMPARCNYMLTYIKQFEKETNKIIKEADINQLFTSKNAS